MSKPNRWTRRTSLKSLGLMGAASVMGGSVGASAAPSGASVPDQPSELRREIFAKVMATTLIDTHEHLCEEQARLAGFGPDDWSAMLSGYLGSDLISAGMPRADFHKFYSKGPSPQDKWKLLEPYWSAVKTTGYGLAARISMQELYGIDDLSAENVAKAQEGYQKLRHPGFYREVLCEKAEIESCQVNSTNPPFIESAQPTLLMQDISLLPMFVSPDFDLLSKPAGMTVTDLASWHAIIDWWFAKYSPFAVAVKSQDAYNRNIDYERVPAADVEGTFQKRAANQPLNPEERKKLQDHLFWYAVEQATKHGLPVKLHTGYYAGENHMPLSRLIHNAESACELCRQSPETKFVFMHICYPYYEELLAVAKQYTNAHIDMCWSWIINPVAAKDFLKKYIVSAPTNKIVTFGGDYGYVEQVLGHAIIARRGIALALCELVEEGWLSRDDVLGLVDPLMNGNARRIFRLEARTKALQNAPWSHG